MHKHAAWGPFLLGACAVLLCACSKHPAGAEAPEKAAPPASQRPAAATLGIAGQLFTGKDPAALQSYLQSVRDVKPASFEVKWNPATVAVSREAAIRSLRSISLDGSTFRFLASEPAIANLKVGSILWIWDIAVRKVDLISLEDDITAVHTQPVALNEALTEAHIAFESAVSLPDYYVGYARHEKPPPAKAARTRPRPGFLLVVDENPSPSPSNPDASDTGDDSDSEDSFEEARPTHGAWSSSLKGFDYSLAYDTRPNGVTLTLEAANAEEGETEETRKEGKEAVAEKYKELTTEKKEAAKEEREAQKQLDALQKDLQQLDNSYQQQVEQAKADQAARSNPGYQGPKPPPVPTDSNGFPLSLQGQIDKLTKTYQDQQSVELGKVKEQLKIRAEAQKRKMEAEDARKKLADLGGAAKKLFEVAKDNLDVRFRARVDLDNFAVAGLLDIKNGNLENAKAQFKQVNGKLDLAFIGRWGKPGNGAIKVPVMNLPIAFNIPFPIGGLPFVIQLGSDFLVNVFLAGNHASQSFHGAFVFNGSGAIHTANSATTADSTMTGEEPEVKEQQAMSPGVSGLVLGVQVPRLGFGFGVAGMSSVAYMDVVNVLTMTNSAAVAVGLAPPCKRVSLTSVGHVGISTTVVPWPIPYVADKINDALSTKPKEIFKKEKVVLDPPIKACEV
ncbi:MAG TPA: hypothetical protein VMT66_17215 [Steroidobacteraceae bacterium]|nr:hypothetical protein [Steroidobacteraceae bacterium]